MINKNENNMRKIILSFILAIVATLTATAQDINAWLQEQLNASADLRHVDYDEMYEKALQKGICRKLQDLDYFKSFRLDPFTVDWNDEIGFAPRYLYERGMAA